MYSNFPFKIDFDSYQSSKIQFDISEPVIISVVGDDIAAKIEEIIPEEPSLPFSYNLVIVKTDSMQGESFYSGNGRTFISFVPSDEQFDLRQVLDRLEAIQFKTSFEGINVKPLLRTQKLRFIALEGSSNGLVEGFHRFFGPFLNEFNSLFDFDVRFQRQQVTKLPDDFILSAEFFSGSRGIARFAENDEVGPERPFRFVFLAGANEQHTSIFIPNWGVVVQGHWDQMAVMQIFISALRKQLGFSATPFGAFSQVHGTTAVERDVFFFSLNKSYAEETIRLLKLSSKLHNEPISPRLFASHFPALQAAFLRQPQEAFIHAYGLHYDESRLGAPYFPDEHKFAVYLPVVFPLLMPLLVGLIKYLKSLKDARKKLKKE